MPRQITSLAEPATGCGMGSVDLWGRLNVEASAWTQEDGHLWAAWERDSAQGRWCCPSRPLSNPCHPMSPCMTPVCSEPLSFRVSAREHDFLCWPFRRAPGSLADSSLSLVGRIPADFHSQMVCELLFRGLVLRAGEPSRGLKSQAPHGEPLQLGYPSRPSITTCGC